MEYYIASPQGPLGPYTIEQLKARQLKPDDLLWRDGLTEWTKACELEELSAVLNSQATPPTFDRAAFENANNLSTDREQEQQQNTTPAVDNGPCPPTYRWLAIIAFLGLVPCAIVALIKSIMVTRLWEEGNPAGAARQSRQVLIWGI
ncbi:MAG: GYF domain-containing protein, partial [Muribaculaceae bacterium]|nr:GYF domain-containing protein [Muribaculaceae bacterium]